MVDAWRWAVVAGVVAFAGAAGHAEPTGPTGPAEPPEAREVPAVEIRELGAAIPEVNVRGADFGTLHDGTPVVFAVSMGEPLTLNLIDVRTGELLDSAAIDGETQGGPVHRAPDGTFYVTVFAYGQPGAVYRYHPDERRLELLGRRLEGESRIYRITSADDDGTVYMTTHPNAKLLAYDPQTGRIRDFGRVADGIDAGSGVTVVGDEVWIGTRPTARLIAVHRKTGATREVPIPEAFTNTASIIGRLEKRGDRVFAHFGPGTAAVKTGMLNLETGAWSAVDPHIGAAAGMTRVDDDGLAYFVTGRRVYSYDVETDEIRETGMAGTGAQAAMRGSQRAYGINLLDIDGRTAVVGMTNAGTVWHYFPGDETGDAAAGQVRESAARIVGFDVGPDGKVYVGAKMGADAIGRIDPGTDQIERLGGPSQGEGVGGAGDTILIGEYPGARLHIGDLSQPWRWGHNPRELARFGRGGPHYQDRLWAIEPIGDRFAVASIPEPAHNGGALILVDPATEECQLFRDVIEGQSLIDLAFRDGLLYVGTSIHGGSGSQPVTSEAHLFIWDVAAGRKVWQVVPIPGAPNISGLTWSDDGMLWGLSETGEVFEFDPAPDRRQVTRRVSIFENRRPHPWGMHSSLVYDPQSDGFWGTMGGRLFHLDRSTLTATIVDREHVLYRLVRAGNGNLYAAGNALVYRIDTPSGASE